MTKTKSEKNPQKNPKKNKNMRTRIVSLVAAIIIWVVVVVFIVPEYPQVISNVPVSLDQSRGQLQVLKLTELDILPATVTVTVTGNRTVVNRLTAADIVVNANAGGVLVPGKYDLQLTAEIPNLVMSDVVITVDPSVVSVRFDELVSEQRNLDINIEGLINVPSGFIAGTPTASVATVTLSGPAGEVALINRCVLNLEIEEELTTQAVRELPVVLLDAKGEEIDPATVSNVHLSVDKATVVVPVYKQKSLQLKIDITNVPANMSKDDIKYTINPAFIDVAGPQDLIDVTEAITLADPIDLRRVGLDHVVTQTIHLRDNFMNVDEVGAVNIMFDTTGMKERTFTISKANIRYINEQSNFEYEITTPRISGVRIIGMEEDVDLLMVDDLFAEIDLEGVTHQNGEIQVGVRIILQTEGIMWPYGEYSAIIKMTEIQ